MPGSPRAIPILLLLASCGGSEPLTEQDRSEPAAPVDRVARRESAASDPGSRDEVEESADSAPSERVSWEDPAGDVVRYSNAPDLPRLDLVAAAAWSEYDTLHIELEVADSLDDHFAYVDEEGMKHAGVLAEIYLDTDDDASTGGHPTYAREADRPLSGYEFVLSVQLGYDVGYLEESEGSGSVAADVLVDTARMEVTGSFATFQGRKLAQGSDGWDFDFAMPDWEAARGQTELGGQSVALRVPYEWLGVEPGQVVRLCFKEVAEGGASGRGFSADRWLRLE